MEQDNKEIQRKRMMSYFIKAAEQIIEQEGLDRVTIRNVARIAAYNSATLYNYFDDLDHLLFFTLMKYLKDYTLALSDAAKEQHEPLELFYASWSIFSINAFSMPRIYYSLFFNKHRDKLRETLREYYEIFPEEFGEQPNVVADMLREVDIFKRNRLLLEAVMPDSADIDDINRIMVHTFASMLLECSTGNDERAPEDVHAELMRTVRFLLRGRV